MIKLFEGYDVLNCFYISTSDEFETSGRDVAKSQFKLHLQEDLEWNQHFSVQHAMIVTLRTTI